MVSSPGLVVVVCVTVGVGGQALVRWPEIQLEAVGQVGQLVLRVDIDERDGGDISVVGGHPEPYGQVLQVRRLLAVHLGALQLAERRRAEPAADPTCARHGRPDGLRDRGDEDPDDQAEDPGQAELLRQRLGLRLLRHHGLVEDRRKSLGARLDQQPAPVAAEVGDDLIEPGQLGLQLLVLGIGRGLRRGQAVLLGEPHDFLVDGIERRAEPALSGAVDLTGRPPRPAPWPALRRPAGSGRSP